MPHARSAEEKEKQTKFNDDVFNGETYCLQVTEPTTRISTMYPMMGLPPSFDGGFQCTVMEWLVVLSHSGTPGWPGNPAAAHVEGKKT